jgi:hypothetical protein
MATFNVFDSITATEALVYDPDLVYVSEFVFIVIPSAPLSIFVFDPIIVTDFINESTVYDIFVSETVTSGESFVCGIVKIGYQLPGSRPQGSDSSPNITIIGGTTYPGQGLTIGGGL